MMTPYIIITAVLAVTGIAVMWPRGEMKRGDILFIVAVALAVIVAVALIVIGSEP